MSKTVKSQAPENELSWKLTLKKWISGFLCGKERIASVDEGAAPLICLALATGRKVPLVIAVPMLAMAERMRSEMELWAAVAGVDFDCMTLPEGMSGGRILTDAEAPRAEALRRALHAPPRFFTASAPAILSPVPPPRKMIDSELCLKPGMEFPLEKLADRLVSMDYDDEQEVSNQGEFARRGGLVDIFSPSCSYPARIEYWGDTIESIREFSPLTQLSVRKLDEYKIIMRSGSAPVQAEGEAVSDFSDYTDTYKPLLVVVFPEECRRHLERFGDADSLKRWDALLKKHEGRKIELLDAVESAAYGRDEVMMSPCHSSAAHLLKAIPEGTEDSFSELVRQLSADLIRQWLSGGNTVGVLGQNEGDMQHLAAWLRDAGLERQEKIECDAAKIPCGVYIPDANLALFSEYELFSTPRRLRVPKVLPQKTGSEDEKGLESDITLSMADIEEGDYAVHINYGICIFRGLKTIETPSSTFEALELEFDDDSLMHVPVWQAHCVSRYIGAKKGSVKLSKIGSARWSKTKNSAASSVRELAFDMLRMHAMRSSVKGCAFPPDDLSQRFFEQAFPFTETPDQLKAASEIKSDMESEKPMDRLLCGDVGYGKTEVAMRAVFKCVMSGKQAAILVPTTVLAQQHYYNFLERFAEHPFIIETLSRFKSKSEQNRIVERLAEGSVDIVIGTHRLLQKDICFKNLGLVVVDEEQRFGVMHKEQLKRLRASVDVLTMTATPIPRTLYLSMSGMRDLSTIMSAPVQRLPIQTVVAQFEPSVVKNAIEREINRGGQVYYLHNRVATIDDTAKMLGELIPGVRIGVGHGQMEEHELESVMSMFIEGKLDVLVCTTIIESGLDIPNANTIIIDRADRFGLAELYQLRGRVGRWSRQAYSYLLLPKDGILTGDARRRISAIRKFTHLGSGFKLALRDLEIRGAGNILGSEQSGHINAVGFNLYCQLLKATISQLRGEAVESTRDCNVYIDFIDYSLKTKSGKLSAAFPEEYINAPRLRLEAYRRLAGLRNRAELESFEKELTDRFGALPDMAVTLIRCTRIRVMGIEAGVNSISLNGDKIIIEKGIEILKQEGKIPRLVRSISLMDKLLDIEYIVSNMFFYKK